MRGISPANNHASKQWNREPTQSPTITDALIGKSPKEIIKIPLKLTRIMGRIN